MHLHPSVDLSRLTFKATLTAQERSQFRILSRAYKILRATDSAAAAEVRDQALRILRIRYHKEYDAMNRHQRLDESEWDAIQSYFPSRYHRMYFSSSLYGRRINAYLHHAERVYDDVSIRGRGRDTDFIIVGTEPGSRIPSMLARIHKSGAAAPNLYEIKQIVRMRNTFWQSSKPCIIGLVAGALLGFVVQGGMYGSAGVPKDSVVIPLFTLLGMAAGLGIMYCVNRIKAWRFVRAFPHLNVAA